VAESFSVGEGGRKQNKWTFSNEEELKRARGLTFEVFEVL
jgi:hypothetical protein